MNLLIAIAGSPNLKKRFTRGTGGVYTHPRVALRMRGTGFCFWRGVDGIYLTSSTFESERENEPMGEAAMRKSERQYWYFEFMPYRCVLDAIWEQSTERHAANQTLPWIPWTQLYTFPHSVRVSLSISLPLTSFCPLALSWRFSIQSSDSNYPRQLLPSMYQLACILHRCCC